MTPRDVTHRERVSPFNGRQDGRRTDERRTDECASRLSALWAKIGWGVLFVGISTVWPLGAGCSSEPNGGVLCGDGTSCPEGHFCLPDSAGGFRCLEQGVCGDGIFEPGEGCDDGNGDKTDGCPEGLALPEG